MVNIWLIDRQQSKFTIEIPVVRVRRVDAVTRDDSTSIPGLRIIDIQVSVVGVVRVEGNPEQAALIAATAGYYP